MLLAHSLRFAGRSGDLVPPLDLRAYPGELLLAVGDGQDNRTALSLLLGGRMRPTSGTVSWGPDGSAAELRRLSALVDSPAVNEPERHLRVRDLVSEDLALVPGRGFTGCRPGRWLEANGFAAAGDLWVEELSTQERIGLLCRLALADPAVRLLVLDSPDRHATDPADWLPPLLSLASAGDSLCLVAVVAAVPDGWDGPTVHFGAAPTSSERMVSA